jgi:DNA-binding CsgD family transcriptional regulator
MFVSRETVKTHVAHIFRKLNVHNRAELSAQNARRKTTN